jgi:hypothetical protein
MVQAKPTVTAESPLRVEATVNLEISNEEGISRKDTCAPRAEQKGRQRK